MSASNKVPHPRDIARAVEELRCTHSALLMAASGIGAYLHHNGDPDAGVYYLLMTVADKMESGVVQLEQLTGCADKP